MADIVTGTVTGQLDVTSILEGQSDIRRENVVESKDIIDAVKSSAAATQGVDTQYFIAGQQYAFSNATALAALKASTDASFVATQNAIQLAAKDAATATALASAATQMLIVQEAVKGRELAEKNLVDNLRADLERERAGHRHWESSFYQSQSANLNSQIQALHSQFQNATQGTVNFGSMSGNAGRNTSTNNVV